MKDMIGRIERELKIEDAIERKLVGQPDYIKAYSYWLSGKKPTTRRSYIEQAILFCDYCRDQLGEEILRADFLCRINADLVDSYIRKISFKYDTEGNRCGKAETSSVNTQICSLSAFFRFLISRKLISENFCENVSRPKIDEKESVVYLTPEEVQMMLSEAQKGNPDWVKRDRLLLILPLVTGIRISAMIDINVEDIDMEQKNMRVVEKEGKYRIFSLPDGVIKLIQAWLQDREINMKYARGETNALFITVNHGDCGRISAKTVNRIIKRCAESINKPITAHKLRATFAMSAYEQTEDIYLVSELLGHKSPETTRHYVRATEKKKKEVIDMMGNLVGV